MSKQQAASSKQQAASSKQQAASSKQNANLNRAKREKFDDFYTQLTDIEKELKHYKQHFKDKVVYCNCDDPKVSNFFHYFSYNFEHLGLKKLITTCYKNTNLDLFSQNNSDKAIYLEYTGDKNNNRIPDTEEIVVNKLEGNGDFRSKECIKFLEQADIVVTNPPFSLFREYISQLMKHKKKFLIIGNMNAVDYKEVFKFIKKNRIWLGYNPVKKFQVPEDYKNQKDGFVTMGNVRWFTNLSVYKRQEELILTEHYNPEKHLKYDNYNAINIKRVNLIPKNYEGVMGVPVSFLEKHNPNQFEILGRDYDVKEGLLPELVNPHWKGKLDRGYIDGKRLYSRMLIRRR